MRSPSLLLVSACLAGLLTSTSVLPSLFAKPTVEVDPVRGELIAFTSKAETPVSSAFRGSELEWIRKLASEQGIPLRVIAVEAGAPESVALTPLLVFQNHRGRSVYQGRFTTQARLKNFIETSRWVPQGETPLTRENVLVRRSGRTRTAGVIKVTSPTGPGSADLSATDTIAQIKAHLLESFDRFEHVERVRLGRAERSFYLDFHPYVDETGQWFVSMFVFSQFNCDIPIFKSGDAPAHGATFDEAFTSAARTVEQAVLSAIGSPDNGDGFDPVPSSTPARSWGELGLTLPEPPETGAVDTSGLSLATDWKLERSANASGTTSRLVFAFPAPLDSYTGELREFTSALRFGEGLGIRTLRGQIEVEKKSITMGDPHLDESLLEPDMLAAKEHPTASFVIESVDGEDRPIEFGVLVPATLAGTFTMKGRSIPLSTTASFEALVTAEGRPQLVAEGQFQIRLLEAFDIIGPDGPEVAKDTLVFHYRLVYSPAAAE